MSGIDVQSVDDTALLSGIITNQTDGTQKTQTFPGWSGSIDAFGRQRVSSPNTVFDIQNQYDAGTLFFENSLTGGATVTHLPNESAIALNVGTASGDKAIRQSRQYLHYTPAKSQLVILSRVFAATKANVRQRSGYFDTKNGLFFEDNGTNFAVVQRSFTSGSTVDTRIAKNSWNVDVMDGSGSASNKSGLNLDPSKENVYWIDMEWLGGGPTRFGIFYRNQPVICHIFENENALPTPYMTTANLPLRTEIENTGVSASATTHKIICSSVISEDGNGPLLGVNFSVSNGITSTSVTTRRAVLSIRPKATFNSITNRMLFEDFSYEIIAGNNNSYYEIVYGGTIGGSPSWASANASSGIEFDVAGTTVTGGIVVNSGYAISGSGSVRLSTGQKSVLSKLPLTLDISGANPIPLSIVCTSFSGTSNINACIGWKEVQ